MRVYNTYTKQVEAFTIDGDTVRIYNCGPTVYDYAHIGNFRSFVFADLLRRYLEFKGYKVEQVMNFTDVGHMTQDDFTPSPTSRENVDKMALAAQRTGIQDPQKLADYYIEKFMIDSRSLRCKEPDKRPRASEHVTEMIQLIEQLLQKGHAYEVDGFVYFDVSSFGRYGKLSGNDPEELIAGHRVDVDPNKKRATDFALWKRDEKHIMKWPSPWGTGFPGWHIECSAMAMKYLGETLDIHTGGEDNIFPHHESEIAQSEGVTGKTFARYWLHVRFLLVDNSKMSKSKGNFFTVQDLIKLGYKGEEIRYALISRRYGEKMNFVTGIEVSDEEDVEKVREKYSQIQHIESLEEAKAAIRRINEFITSMKQIKTTQSRSKNFSQLSEKVRENFEKALDDDFNTSEALAVIFQFIRETNKIRDGGGLSQQQAEKAINIIRALDEVLAILPESQEIPHEIRKLVEEREEARRNKDYATADARREGIEKLGYTVKDTADGPVVSEK